MVIYRCTRKLLKKGLPIIDSSIESDTILGDWYIDYIPRRPFHLLLFTSEKSLLPIIIAAVPLRTFIGRFKEQLHDNLLKIGIGTNIVEREIKMMEEHTIMKTVNRRVLGTMNEYKYAVDCYEYDKSKETLEWLTWHIAETPCSAIEKIFPIEAVRELFGKA
jgi:hypothetical protein